MRNLTPGSYASVCAFLMLLVLHGGCAISDPDEWPGDFVQRNALPQLIGKHESEVLKELGAPTYFVSRESGVSYLFQDIDEDTVILVFLLPLGQRKGAEVNCVLLNFDQKRILREYKIHSVGGATGASGGRHDCQTLLGIDGDDLFHIDACVYERIGRNLRVQEDYQRYLACEVNDPARLAYLCRAADQGHPNAQVEVGRYFAMGVDGVRQDYVRAYVWYSLAASGCFGDGHLHLIMKTMTSKQIADGKRMLTSWQAGQCEGGLISDWRSGSRSIQTLRKLPINSPAIIKIIISKTCSYS